MYSVYVLRNPQGRLYVGFTTNLQRRLRQHQENEGGWTRNLGPWGLVHWEQFLDRTTALRRERALKSGKGRLWLRQHLNGGAGPPQAD